MNNSWTKIIAKQVQCRDFSLLFFEVRTRQPTSLAEKSESQPENQTGQNVRFHPFYIGKGFDLEKVLGNSKLFLKIEIASKDQIHGVFSFSHVVKTRRRKETESIS